MPKRMTSIRHTGTIAIRVIPLVAMLAVWMAVNCTAVAQDEEIETIDWQRQTSRNEKVGQSYLEYQSEVRLPDDYRHGSRPYRTMRLNPFSIQQGIGDWLFLPHRPADPDSLGFPLSLVPWCWADRIPKPDFFFPDSRYLGRHQGIGMPLVGESWRNRPWHGDFLLGGLFLDDLTADQTRSSDGTLTGARLGWDFDHYWGTEFRFAASEPQLIGRSDQASVRYADVSVAYYPWGDSRIRPFTSLGVGVNTVEYLAANSNPINETLLSVPISLGTKYYLKKWLTLRGEVTNNMAFGGKQLNSMFSWSVTGGVEMRFGGRQSRYYPYDAGVRIR